MLRLELGDNVKKNEEDKQQEPTPAPVEWELTAEDEEFLRSCNIDPE